MSALYFQLLGTRGSRPILARDFLRFGGNTTAYKIWADGVLPLYIDGGTGLFREGRRISPDIQHFLFLLTHSHWDHILAFPFFEPFYRSSTHAKFWGSRSFKETFEELFQHQFQTDAFPIHYSELPARIDFVTITSNEQFVVPATIEAMQISTGSAQHPIYHVHSYQLNHPGLDFGYRIEYGDKAIVVLTDTAPIENNHMGHGMKNFTPTDEIRYYQGLVELCRNANLMLYDTHFNEQNIKGRESWGHSTEIMAVKVAIEAQARRLILGHHAPEDNDMAILAKWENAKRLGEPHGVEVLVPEEDSIIKV